jgi:glutathione S-transferase
MTATLYGIPGSHAVRTGELMLEHKGIAFRRKNFPAGPHRVLVRLAGFKGDRVPAVKFDDGRRAQGTRELPRVLDELVPGARLVPDDPRALEAEAWADDVLQQWARRMVASAGVADPDALAGRGAEGRLGVLLIAGADSWRAPCWSCSGRRRSSCATTASEPARSSIG